MRVNYIPPSVKEFDILFNTQNFHRGGALSDIKTFNPEFIQRGSGVFSILNTIVRNSLPFLKRIFLPAAGEFTSNVLNDYFEGKSFKEAVKTNGVNTAKSIGRRIVRGGSKKKTSLKNSSKKRNKKKKNIGKTKKKCKPRDIFGL